MLSKRFSPTALGVALMGFALAAPVAVAQTVDTPPRTSATEAPKSERPEAERQTEISALPEDATLLDAWLALEAQGQINGSHAFVTREEPRDRQRRLRIVAELEGLSTQARLLGAPEVAEGLTTWQRRIDDRQPLRIPGRVDPTWLMAHLREVPRLRDIDRLGWCTTPNWVEAWTPLGVTRVPWHEGMTTQSVLDALPGAASERADTLSAISPQGDIAEIGIAAWNHASAPLAPGSRVLLPIPLSAVGAQWLDGVLPSYLASLLPGDDCTSLTPDKIEIQG